MAGNFFGDHVKGGIKKDLPQGIQDGIAFHRFIDSYTDSHDRTREARELLFSDYRHFSGVLTDIFWDYFLAKNWGQFHDKSLEEFTNDSYATLAPFLVHFPSSAGHMFNAMRKGNWLLRYAEIEGIAASFRGLSNRVRIANPLYGAEEALLRYERDLERIFQVFFQDLHSVCKSYLAKHGYLSD